MLSQYRQQPSNRPQPSQENPKRKFIKVPKTNDSRVIIPFLSNKHAFDKASYNSSMTENKYTEQAVGKFLVRLNRAEETVRNSSLSKLIKGSRVVLFMGFMIIVRFIIKAIRNKQLTLILYLLIGGYLLVILAYCVIKFILYKKLRKGYSEVLEKENQNISNQGLSWKLGKYCIWVELWKYYINDIGQQQQQQQVEEDQNSNNNHLINQQNHYPQGDHVVIENNFNQPLMNEYQGQQDPDAYLAQQNSEQVQNREDFKYAPSQGEYGENDDNGDNISPK